MEQVEHSVLRRKAARRRAGPVAVPPARALELALARAAQEELGLGLRVEDLIETGQEPEDLAKAAGAHALLAVLDGPGGRAGLAVLSAPLLGAVMAQRMTGRLPPGGVAVPRPPTRIDADMTRDLIDRVLAAFEAPLAGQSWALGFRYRGYLADVRLLRFSLAEAGYRSFTAELRLGADANAVTGQFVLTLPSAVAGADDPAQAPASAVEWEQALQAHVLDAGLEVVAVLTRLRLPLAQIATLKAGDALPLPRATIGAITLEAAGRARVGFGQLGQSRGARAVRLNGGDAIMPEKNAPGMVPDAPEFPQQVALPTG